MPYRIAEHVQRGNTRHMKILVNPESEAGFLVAMTVYENAKAAWEAADTTTRGAPPEKPTDPRIYEEFAWGMDVPLDQVRRETRLLLDAKHAPPAQPAERVLPGAGTTL